MQAFQYYPTKLRITADGEDAQDPEDHYSYRLRRKARRLQDRRWRRLQEIEEHEHELRSREESKIQQTLWLKRHGWPRVAQPLV